MNILTRAELDAVQVCEDCGEVHGGPMMWMSTRCHPQAGLAIGYERSTGLAHVHCNECGAPVGQIAVAETPPAWAGH